MNKGEGARIAAKSKSGQVGIYLFKEPEKRKKKFNYKSRTQGFSVRKVATVENPQVSRPQSELSQKGSTVLKKKDALKKPILKNNSAAKTKPIKSQHNVNFVEKNIQTQKKKSGLSANTVTLTQDQLNKILLTLGGENASIKFENGDIKIKDTSDEIYKQDHKGEDIPGSKSDKENENIANTVEQLSHSKGIVSNATENTGSNRNQAEPVASQQNNQVRQEADGTRVVTENESVTSPRTNLGDISSIGTTGYNDKDDAEKRRRQWREELDKQVAEKQKEKERMKKVRLSGDGGAGQWSPWGNLGDSGGRGQKKVDSTPQVVQSVIHEVPNSQALNSKPEPPSSRMDHSYRQANTPAAMRSSFSFGNYSDESMSIKQKEKEAWLQELEKQRQEAKERQAKEKKQRLEVGMAETDYWARQVPTVNSSVSSQNMETKDDIATEEKRTELVRSETVQSDPLSGTTAPQQAIITPRGHQRSQWSLTDPAEVERQGKARTKHLEHMEAVKAQVEEKQRLKWETLEKKRREDKEEEEKLAKERENLQKQFEMEAQKQKQKELDALAKHQALVDSMQRAYEESVRLKQEKRMRHLNKHTSDAPTSIHHKEDEPVAPTPRIGGSHGPVQRTPPPPPVTSEIYITQAPVAGIPQKRDVRHSTVIEQGVQTDFASLPEADISPRLTGRDKSAGIEYKQHRKDNSKNSVMRKDDPNTHTKVDRKSPAAGEIKFKEIDIKVKRKKNKISERPKWGVKSEPKKKVKASDKDLTVSKKLREERRKKRMQELLTDQERNKPPPRTGRDARKTRYEESPAFRVIDCADDEIDEMLINNKRNQKRHTSQSNREELHKQEERFCKSRSDHFEDFSQTPPLKTGDFVPFLRTDERLDIDSIPVSPALYRDAQQWEEDIKPEPPRKQAQYQQNYKDPLFSPDIRKDGEHRQKMILKQLSNLREGLMMKQREMELGLSATPSSTSM